MHQKLHLINKAMQQRDFWYLSKYLFNVTNSLWTVLICFQHFRKRLSYFLEVKILLPETCLNQADLERQDIENLFKTGTFVFPLTKHTTARIGQYKKSWQKRHLKKGSYYASRSKMINSNLRFTNS